MGSIDFEFKVGRALAAGHRRQQDQPLRILIMGDFSACDCISQRSQQAPLRDRQPLRVDIDNFEQILSRLSPTLSLPLGNGEGADVVLTFNELDDFHPDTLYRNLALFRQLRQLRRRLADPATFAETAARLTNEVVSPNGVADTPSPGSRQPLLPEDDKATMERLLGRGAMEPRATEPSRKAVEGLIRNLIAPHIEPSVEPGQRQLLPAVDEAIAEQMRRLLHHPHFQQLESHWRGLYDLVSNVETDDETNQVQLYLLDVTKEELAQDLATEDDDLTTSDLFRSAIDNLIGVPGSPSWSLWIGHYTFDASPEDATLLAALGTLASRAGGPFMGAASPGILGCSEPVITPDPADWQDQDPETAKRWQALRQCSAAPWIGLVLPRVLLRLPYGTRTDPVEEFEFQEIPHEPEHQSLLWGNPALICARLIAMAFQQQGWAMELGDFLEVDDLPAYTYRADGETVMQPCAEVLLGERAFQAILDKGIMPLLSYRNRNTVRLARFQALADPPAALFGPWL